MLHHRRGIDLCPQACLRVAGDDVVSDFGHAAAVPIIAQQDAGFDTAGASLRDELIQ